jgi:hypothetical protein
MGRSACLQSPSTYLHRPRWRTRSRRHSRSGPRLCAPRGAETHLADGADGPRETPAGRALAAVLGSKVLLMHEKVKFRHHIGLWSAWSAPSALARRDRTRLGLPPLRDACSSLCCSAGETGRGSWPCPGHGLDPRACPARSAGPSEHRPLRPPPPLEPSAYAASDVRCRSRSRWSCLPSARVGDPITQVNFAAFLGAGTVTFVVAVFGAVTRDATAAGIGLAVAVLNGTPGYSILRRHRLKAGDGTNSPGPACGNVTRARVGSTVVPWQTRTSREGAGIGPSWAIPQASTRVTAASIQLS